jgi:hypothetical protein
MARCCAQKADAQSALWRAQGAGLLPLPPHLLPPPLLLLLAHRRMMSLVMTHGARADLQRLQRFTRKHSQFQCIIFYLLGTGAGRMMMMQQLPYS